MKIELDEVIGRIIGEGPADNSIRAGLIKQQLAAIDHTPDHPVYSALIREALIELNEGNGSSREAISWFIASKYDVLPVIHAGKLIEQLDKLVKSKKITFTSDNCYVLPVDGDGVAPKLRKANKRSRKVKRDHKGCILDKIKGCGWWIQEDITATKEVEVLTKGIECQAPSGIVGSAANIQGCLQVERIGNKPRGKELQLTTEQERHQKEDNISASCKPELSMHELHKDKDSITTSSSSQRAQSPDLGLLLRELDCKKEMYVDSLKKVIALRQELSENIEYASLVEESSLASSQPTVRELVTALQSEIQEIFHSDIGSSSMQDYHPKELHLEFHRENLDFKGHELSCAEKPVRSCRVLTSPDEFLELPNFDLVQQQGPELGGEGQHGVSSCDDLVGTRKTCMLELQKQTKDLGAELQKTSASVSCSATIVHVEQPIEIDATLDEDDLIMVGSSQPVNGEERASNAGLPAKVKQPRRQLRPGTAKSRGCDQSHVEVTSSDVDVVLLPNQRSKRKKKPESPIQKGDQGHSGRLKKSISRDPEEVMQSNQRDLSSPPLQIEKSAGKDSEELLSSHEVEGRQDDPQQPSQTDPRDLTVKEPTPFQGDQYRKDVKRPRGRPRKLVDSADKSGRLSSPSKRGAKQIQGQPLDHSEPLIIATASSRGSEGGITRAKVATNEAATASPSPKCGQKQKFSQWLLAQYGAEKSQKRHLQRRPRKAK